MPTCPHRGHRVDDLAGPHRQPRRPQGAGEMHQIGDQPPVRSGLRPLRRHSSPHPNPPPQAGEGALQRWRSASPASRGRGARREAVGGWGSSVTGLDLARRGGDFGLDLLQQLRRLAALDAGDVVLVFEQHAQRVVDRLAGSARARRAASAPRPSRSSRRCRASLNRSILRSFCTNSTTWRDRCLRWRRGALRFRISSSRSAVG